MEHALTVLSGLSLREMIHEFKYQTLVLFKGLLLEPKVCVCRYFNFWVSPNSRQMLFFGSRCERLCMIQFSLISLIPGLINNLGDCADPSFDNYTQTVEKPTSLKTSERSSCMLNYTTLLPWLVLIIIVLAYMGLPLQIFGKVVLPYPNLILL